MTVFIGGILYELTHPKIKDYLTNRFGNVIQDAMGRAHMTRTAVEPYFL